ncbi:DUF2147 domain-containing protein [Rhodobacterales bacterium HKCCE3408]|nr:DUF2147 domain-containing protein [Rhodobacterales bacterium HKCCE3408]
MMRTALAAAVTLAALAMGSAAFAQDALIGDWRTAPDDNGNTGLIRVTQCGTSLCGTLVEAYGPSGSQIESENIGRQIIWDTNPTTTAGEYQGQIYSPDRDATYNSRLYLSGDSIEVCGRRFGIERCSGNWTRVQ